MARKAASRTRPRVPRAKAGRKPPLRLEWIRAGDLADHPANWRRHPAGQVLALKELLADPQVGWAGALLYNERTRRLVDGHARRDAVPPETLVPVLVGSWDDTGERKILATLDPLASMAEADPARLQTLLEGIAFDGEGLAALVAGLEADLAAELGGQEAGGDGGSADPSGAREAGMTVRCPKCGHRFRT